MVRYPYGLTRRQYDIACHSHLSNEEIAAQLMISENTVHSHMKLIFKKLNVLSRHEIQYVLFNQNESRFKEEEALDEPTGTISITIPEKVSRIWKILELIQRGD